MKKILASLGVFLILGMSFALAFNVDKDAIVTGDWVWDGGWTLPDPSPMTARYTLDVDSFALEGYYGEFETIGTPWEYDLSNSIITNAPTNIGNWFGATTINDPVTTPATGGYTTYGFEQTNVADYSSSHLSVVGEGAVDVFTSLTSTSGVHQNNVVGVN